MTRTVKFNFSSSGATFDFSRPCYDFECQAQRCFVYLLTEKESNKLYPDVGTTFGKLIGKSNADISNNELLALKDELLTYTKQFPYRYNYEALADVKFNKIKTATAVVVVLGLISVENLMIGELF